MDNSEGESGTTVTYIIECKSNRKNSEWKMYVGFKDLEYAVDRAIILRKACPNSHWRILREETALLNVPELC